MKILILIDSLDTGGAETHVETLAKHLDKMGCEVILASQGGKIANRLKEQGIKHITLPTYNTNIKYPFKIKDTPLVSFGISYEVLKRIVLQNKPDIIHAHTRKTTLLAQTICKKEHIPLITTAHAIFSMRGAKNLLSFWGDGTIAISEDIKNYISKRSIFKPKLIKIIRNGVSIS